LVDHDHGEAEEEHQEVAEREPGEDAVPRALQVEVVPHGARQREVPHEPRREQQQREQRDPRRPSRSRRSAGTAGRRGRPPSCRWRAAPARPLRLGASLETWFAGTESPWSRPPLRRRPPLPAEPPGEPGGETRTESSCLPTTRTHTHRHTHRQTVEAAPAPRACAPHQPAGRSQRPPASGGWMDGWMDGCSPSAERGLLPLVSPQNTLLIGLLT
ncbi:unnamed protein product, partial [Tetraodon nigroviridis]